MLFHSQKNTFDENAKVITGNKHEGGRPPVPAIDMMDCPLHLSMSAVSNNPNGNSKRSEYQFFLE